MLAHHPPKHFLNSGNAWGPPPEASFKLRKYLRTTLHSTFSICKTQKSCQAKKIKPRQLFVKVINGTIIPGTLEHVEQKKEDK